MDAQPQDITDLQETIQLLHGCKSSYCRTVLVEGTLAGHLNWNRLVKVFDVFGHPTAECCFAWTYHDEGAIKRVAVLNLPPVDSPESAVRTFSDPREPGEAAAPVSVE